MKLDRSASGTGKYAIVNLRKTDPKAVTISGVDGWFIPRGELLFGAVGSDDEFFVMMLKDRYALMGLAAYADAARKDDPEYADEIAHLSCRAGRFHPSCKRPD